MGILMKDIRLSKQKIIDNYLGNLINSILIFKKRFSIRTLNIKPKKIIIYKLDAIGDSILCLPMIKSLKEKTKVKIIIACSKSNFDIFQGQEFVDKIVIFDNSGLNLKNLISNIRNLQAEKADISIDAGQTSNISAIMSSLTSKYTIGFAKIEKSLRDRMYDSLVKINFKKHMILSYNELVKNLDIAFKENLELTKLAYEKKDAEKIKNLINEGKFVGIHPFHSISSKEWPYERFAKIIEFLIKKDYKIVLTNDKNESGFINKLFEKIDKKYHKKIIDLSGKLNLKELIALMPQLKLFIANDGGPMHISAAMGTPTIGLFGYENPRRYYPIGSKNISLYNVENHDLCDEKFLIEWPKCRNPEHIKQISTEEVKKTISSILK